MLYYDRIDISEGIDTNKASSSKECDICHYSYFVDKGLKFQPHDYNDVLVMFVSLNNIANRIRKNDAVNLLQNVDFTEKRGILSE